MSIPTPETTESGDLDRSPIKHIFYGGYNAATVQISRDITKKYAISKMIMVRVTLRKVHISF